MKAFLQEVAEYIYQKHGDNLKNLTILMPNRRSCIFLKQEIAKLCQKTTFLPEIVSLQDWIDDNSSLTKIEDVVAIFKLFNSFKNFYPIKANLKIEDFYFLGEILLRDFNDIDNALVDASKLFINIKDENEIKNLFNLDLEPDFKDYFDKLIKYFNKSFSENSYLDIWNKLHDLYKQYRESLIKDNLAYEGLQIRHFVENEIENSKNINEKIFYFIGFNFITQAEYAIFNKLKDKANFIWEYDDEYINNNLYSAGKQLSWLIKDFPMPADFNVKTNNLGDDLKNVKDKIKICSFTNEVEMAKYAAQHIKNLEQYQAIILPDDSLLPVVLTSLPDDIKSVNITMNYSINNTNAYTLIMQIFDLYNNIRKNNNKILISKQKWVELLYHPFIYENNYVKDIINNYLYPTGGNSNIQEISDFIEINNINTADKPLIDKLLSIINANGTIDFMNHLLELLSYLEENLKTTTEKSSMLKLEFEAIRQLYTKLQETNVLFDQYKIVITDIKFLISLITEILREIKIELEGEPLEALQVMGLMESRLLDFQKVIILSLNNKIVPGDKYIPTFIPYLFRKHFQLPTQDWREGIDAFHIYRLLQRSEDIHLLSSRFIADEESDYSPYLLQLKYRGIDIKNFTDKIGNSPKINDHKVKSDAKNKVHNYLNNNNKKGLSRHAISTYIQCPRKFYFKYIENLTDNNLFPEEAIERELGTLIHQALNKLFDDNKNVDIGILQYIKNDIDNKCDVLLPNNNSIKVLLLKHQLKSMLKKFFDVEINPQTSHFPATILGVEQKVTFQLINNVQIEGTIDLIIKNNKGVYIIDFKTGSEKGVSYTEVEDLFVQNSKMEYVFQLAFYCYLYCKNIKYNIENDISVFGENIYLKSYNKAYKNELKKDKNVVNFYDEKKVFEDLLTIKIDELKNDEKFELTKDQKNCIYCEYQLICRRTGG
ncbi:MAG TPA: PD-(D/E)XK nuclease family protein [Bacteroidales bacterium]|nr:PD-(D/E)XK nuclease family protein [Bacteroidales bacterium]